MNKDILFVNENPAYLAVGMAVSYTYTWPATVTSPTTTLYKDGTSYSDVMSGSDTSSGATQTSKTITPVAADIGSKYRLELKATFNSRTEIKYLDIYIMEQE